jgi:hypothetical protein
MASATAVPHIVASGDLAVNVASWARDLRAGNLSHHTVKT